MKNVVPSGSVSDYLIFEIQEFRRILSYLMLPFFLSLSQNTGHLLNTRFYLKSQCLLTKPHVHFSHFHFPLLSELHSFYFYPLLHFLFSFPSQFTVCSFWGWLKNFTCAAFIFLFHLVLLLWLPTMFRICNSRISKTMEISCGSSQRNEIHILRISAL